MTTGDRRAKNRGARVLAGPPTGSLKQRHEWVAKIMNHLLNRGCMRKCTKESPEIT